MIWTDNERIVMHDVLSPNSHSRSALQKFCAMQAEKNRKSMQSAMTSHPRKTELAADYAAKAEAYDELLQRLDAEIEKT